MCFANFLILSETLLFEEFLWNWSLPINSTTCLHNDIKLRRGLNQIMPALDNGNE